MCKHKRAILLVLFRTRTNNVYCGVYTDYIYTLHPSQNSLIEHLIQQDSISATTIDILSASIHGEAQQVLYAPETIDHMEQVVNLLNSRDDAIEYIDEQDANVRTATTMSLSQIKFVVHAVLPHVK